MTKTTKKTKFAAILLSLAMIIGMFSVIGVTSASAATDKVSLYSSSITFTKYGATTYEVYIQTRDDASNQQVYVHYLYMDSLGWTDAKAEYVTTLNDGSKIWKAYFTSMNTHYAIKFVADGREYWDNNNGKDYNGTETVGVAPIAPQRNASACITATPTSSTLFCKTMLITRMFSSDTPTTTGQPTTIRL